MVVLLVILLLFLIIILLFVIPDKIIYSNDLFFLKSFCIFFSILIFFLIFFFCGFFLNPVNIFYFFDFGVFQVNLIIENFIVFNITFFDTNKFILLKKYTFYFYFSDQLSFIFLCFFLFLSFLMIIYFSDYPDNKQDMRYFYISLYFWTLIFLFFFSLDW
jgi:hypothetical protein